jgi:FkbM family methyltransferase
LCNVKLEEICKLVQSSDSSENRDEISSFVSVSQCEQDKLVLKLLDGKRNGFFVDLAANDYMKLSNSYSIERYFNWSGICIEPNPEYLDGILSHRKCKLVVNPIYSGMNETVKFRFRGHESGIIGDEMDNKETKEPTTDVELHTVTLKTVLQHFNAPRVIDYFSLDVEGGEYSVLKSFFESLQNNYVFLILTIERPTEQLHNLLLKHHYIFLTSLRQVMYDKSYYGECIYVHHSIPKLQKIYREYRTAEINTAWRNTVSNNLEKHPYLLRGGLN